MQFSTWIALLLLFYLCILLPQRRRRVAAALFLRQKREVSAMEALAKEFLNQECIIYTLTDASGSVQGTIREVRDGGLLVEDRMGQLQAVNLAFVTRIRAYPRNKKGKKKSFVID